MDLWGALEDVGQAADSGEAAIRLARSLWTQPHDPSGAAPWVVDSAQQRRTYAAALARRGHLQEAWPLVRLDGPDGYLNPFVSMALLKAVPESIADAAMRRAARARPSPTWYYNVGRWTRQLLWWRERGDTAELARVAAILQGGTRGLSRPVSDRLSRQARAYVTLLSGDTAAAMEQLASIPDSTCYGGEGCEEPRYLLGRLLAARGRLQEGARMMDRWGALDGPLNPLLWLGQARVAEQLGDADKARRLYTRVTATWRAADPPLQPYVDEARAGLERLAREPPAGTR
jgi:hypothetical protein